MQDTEYDLLVLSNECQVDFDHQPIMTYPKLKEWVSSLNGGCMVFCYSQTWDSASDVWWLPPVTPSDVVIYPGEMVQKLGYESFVFISAQGVTDLMNDLNSSFSMTAVHGEMMQAGAHVAMAAASYDAIESGECVNESDDRRCVGKGGGIGVPAPASGDSPIMVLTLPAWRCLVDRMLMHKLFARDPSSGERVSRYSKSVACSPGGVLSLCNMGQSCIFLDNTVVEAFSEEGF